MSYQAVLVTAAVLITRPVGESSILQSSATGTVAYSETQRPNTNITFSNEAAQ
jgi:hypothetical protein